MAPTSSIIGFFTVSSKTAFRGVNHSRSLCFFRLRRNAMPSAGNPGNIFFIRSIPIIRAMNRVEETFAELSALPNTTVLRDVPLSRYTRFGIGGPADLFAETAFPESFMRAWRIARDSGLETVVIGGGTNLIVSDAGFRGVVLKLSNSSIRADGLTVHVDGGASLQALVDF